MRTISIFITILLVLSGCCEPEAPKKPEIEITLKSLLESSIQKHGEVIFYGWNGMEHNHGAHFRLIFLKDQAVKIEILGYNFVFATGRYNIPNDNLVEILFESVDAPKTDNLSYTKEWPLLRLRQENDALLIYREDGKTNWHIDWPLYPEITDKVWPARTINLEAEQADAGNRAKPGA